LTILENCLTMMVAVVVTVEMAAVAMEEPSKEVPCNCQQGAQQSPPPFAYNTAA
jgi:hypothetical protein